ncbi:hypothetical protein [Acinetobacter variabilis]|uniref:hypothetical protein n=1 Tax=Acinetobacter variabilis TaxID=70346 RepID=UPI0028AE4401|nr:hypothetical protein [Acinetobacter variabilis]
MTLIELFTVLREFSRPLLACEIIFYCVDQNRLNKHFLLKTSIDQALCEDDAKRKSFSKNTITIIGEMEKSGILKKFSVINGVLSEFKGQPYPMAICLSDNVLEALAGQRVPTDKLDEPDR